MTDQHFADILRRQHKGDRPDVLLYNLRHIQHHVGRLHGTLGRRGVQLEWHG
jgi:hypothetical protein